MWIGKTYAETLMVFDSAGSPVTGQAASLQYKLQKNGAYSTTPAVTITEIDSTNFPGAYRVSLTPDIEGDYAIRVWHDTYNQRGWLINFYARKRPAEVWFGAVQNSTATGYDFLAALYIDGVRDAITAAELQIYDDAMTLLETQTGTITSSVAKFTSTTLSLTAGKLYVFLVRLTDSLNVVYEKSYFVRP